MRNFIFFLAGRSGAGKSTLFRSLQGEIFPENVKVSFVKEVKMRPVRTNLSRNSWKYVSSYGPICGYSG